jgi:hypothetical protein
MKYSEYVLCGPASVFFFEFQLSSSMTIFPDSCDADRRYWADFGRIVQNSRNVHARLFALQFDDSHNICRYFGFSSRDERGLLEEKSAFVTDKRRNPSFKHDNGSHFTEDEFWKIAKVATLFESHVNARPARLIETELQTIFHDKRERLWHNKGAGSYYDSVRWIEVFTKEQRKCTVFVTYMRKIDLQGVTFHNGLPLFARA